MSKEDWKKCDKKSKDGAKHVNHEAWRDSILTYFENTDQRHTVNFKSFGKMVHHNKRRTTYDAYAYCRDGACKHFIVVVEISNFKCPPLIEVYSRGKAYHPANILYTRQLNKNRRKVTQKRLKTIKPSVLQDDQIKKLDGDDF